jgi:hypothetical protein
MKLLAKLESTFYACLMDEPTPPASHQLADAIAVQHHVRASDTVRHNVYIVLALTAALCVVPYDLFSNAIASAVCIIILAVGIAFVAKELCRATVIDQHAMISYAIVVAVWSAWWIVLMTIVGPALSTLPIGWTLTGSLGTIPFLGGLAWERRR